MSLENVISRAIVSTFTQKMLSHLEVDTAIVGGGPSALVAARYLAEAGVDRSHIKGYSSDAAQIMTHFNVLRERGINSRLERIDEAAPIYWFSEKSDFPKLLLIWYTEDIVCRPEENILFLRNVERVNPALAARITACELEGKHCSGCKPRPSGETPPYVKLLLEFMK